MDSRLKTVLQYAVMAPSGDNCQPWKFVLNGLQVDLYNDSSRDTSLYNLKQRASLIAHGALLENIRIAAPAVGLHPVFELFPDPEKPQHVAAIRFSEGEKEVSPLRAAIASRHTNREKYFSVKISDSQLDGWKMLPEQAGQGLWITRDPKQIDALADLLSLNDRLVFEEPELHRFLFEQIRWTNEEAASTADGLDIKTLGLSALDRMAFRFLRSWKLVGALNKVGFSRIIQFKAKGLQKSASAIAVVTVPDLTVGDYVQGGQLWQRFLLQLASEGLAAQPIAGLACLMQAAHEGELEGRVTRQHLDQLVDIRAKLLGMVGIEGKGVVLAMFRVGRGPVVARALRRGMDEFF